MLNLNISVNNDGDFKIAASEDEHAMSYDTVVSLMFSGLSAITREVIKSFKGPITDKYKENLHDSLNDLFDRFLNDLFPEFNTVKLDLTSAAIVYAQDQIINKAEAEGKTYEEALKEYEELALAYVNAKKGEH